MFCLQAKREDRSAHLRSTALAAIYFSLRPYAGETTEVTIVS